MREKIHTSKVILVEGKYDAARLAGITDATILCTDGFGIYTDGVRQKMLKALARKNGLIILTDSDAAGFRIRTFVTNIVGAEHVVQAYIPAQEGKEKRKAEPGKEGLLGVEGIADDTLYQILQDVLQTQQPPDQAEPVKREITYTDLYEWGLSGTEGAAERKTIVLKKLGLPPRLSKKALVQVLNQLHTWQEVDCLIQTINAAQQA